MVAVDPFKKDFRNMGLEEVQALYGTVSKMIQVIAKQELEAQLRFGERDFTMKVDARTNVPLRQVKRKVEFTFVAELSGVMLKALLSLAKRASYIGVEKDEGDLRRSWEWYYNGRSIADPSGIKNFGPDDSLMLVNKALYAMPVNWITRRKKSHSIVKYIADKMKKQKKYASFYFRPVYPIIDGRRWPGVLVKLSSKTNFLSGRL